MKKYRIMSMIMLQNMPFYIAAFFLNTFLESVSGYVANVLFMKVVMEQIASGEHLELLFVYLLMLAIFLAGTDIYSSVFAQVIEPGGVEKMQKIFYQYIRNIASRQELYRYDDVHFYDDITYLSENIVDTVQSVLENICAMVSRVVNVVLIGGMFLQLGGGLAIISLTAVVFVLIMDIPISKSENQRRYTSVGFERKRKYFINTFFDKDCFKEIKSSGAWEILETRFRESSKLLKENYRLYDRKLFGMKFIKDFFPSYIIMNFVLIVYLLYETMIVHALAGADFVACFNGVNVVISAVLGIFACIAVVRKDSFAIGKFVDMVSEGMEMSSQGSRKVWVSGNSDHSKGYCGKAVQGIVEVRFIGENKNNRRIQYSADNCCDRDMSCESQEYCGENIGNGSIEFRNVSFAYPGTERLILKNINLTLKPYEQVAIVGKNGSGKSTLIHLLMGLYEPTGGDIYVDGLPLCKSDIAAYRRQFACFFQESKPFSASLAENVARSTDVDRERVLQTLEQISPDKLAKLPLDTIIGKEFDENGVLLSGGELQKLLVSHSIYSHKSYVVMDEPSSALDPVAERELNRKIADLSKDRAVIFVSHRLSTVKMAQYIYVLEDGQIAEQGTHEELIQAKGIYEKMWSIQAEKYGEG